MLMPNDLSRVSVIILTGKTLDHKEEIKSHGGNWNGKAWRVPVKHELRKCRALASLCNRLEPEGVDVSLEPTPGNQPIPLRRGLFDKS